MRNIENTLWTEKYRPSVLSEYIGNEGLKETISKYIEFDDIPHLLFCGRAGTGKTTIGKLITKSIDCDVLYINASDENNVETIRTKIKGYISSVGFKKWKIVLLDEADGLTPTAQGILRNMMEEFSKHARFILTCNYVEKIIEPIQSRCTLFAVHPPSKPDVAKRLAQICKSEGVSFTAADIGTIVNKTYPDIRKSIMLLQQSTSNNKLELSKQVVMESDYMEKVLEVLKSSGTPSIKFGKIRQIIADSKVRTFDEMYRFLYDNLESFAPEGTQSGVIIEIAKAMHNDPFSVDKEINIMALFIEIMNVIYNKD